MINTKGMTEYTCPICKGVWLSDTITLTKKEVEEARDDNRGYICQIFLHYKPSSFGCVAKQSLSPICRLCKKLTEFATVHCPNTGKEGEDVPK